MKPTLECWSENSWIQVRKCLSFGHESSRRFFSWIQLEYLPSNYINFSPLAVMIGLAPFKHPYIVEKQTDLFLLSCIILGGLLFLSENKFKRYTTYFRQVMSPTQSISVFWQTMHRTSILSIDYFSLRITLIGDCPTKNPPYFCPTRNYQKSSK